MKISELVKTLEGIRLESGDLEVQILDAVEISEKRQSPIERVTREVAEEPHGLGSSLVVVIR